MQAKSSIDVAGKILPLKQEIRAQMKLAFVRLKESGTGFNVLEIVVLRQAKLVELFDPAALLIAWRDKIDPYRLAVLQIRKRVNVKLVKPAVIERKNIDHGHTQYVGAGNWLLTLGARPIARLRMLMNGCAAAMRHCRPFAPAIDPGLQRIKVLQPGAFASEWSPFS